MMTQPGGSKNPPDVIPPEVHGVEWLGYGVHQTSSKTGWPGKPRVDRITRNGSVNMPGWKVMEPIEYL